jgi:hypothetical protein
MGMSKQEIETGGERLWRAVKHLGEAIDALGREVEALKAMGTGNGQAARTESVREAIEELAPPPVPRGRPAMAITGEARCRLEASVNLMQQQGATRGDWVIVDARDREEARRVYWNIRNWFRRQHGAGIKLVYRISANGRALWLRPAMQKREEVTNDAV